MTALLRRSRSSTLSLCVIVSMLAVSVGCAHTPPNLSPKGAAAYNATRVVKALDILRDTAVDANAQVPPLVSTATTRKVVEYHKAAILTIGAAPSGWVAVVTTGLDQLVAEIPPGEKPKLMPYVSLAKVLITEVSR